MSLAFDASSRVQWRRLDTVMSERRWLLAAFAVFAFVHALQIGLHLPWEDEYQSWLIAKQSTLSTLISNLRYEGHPTLYYLELMATQWFWDDPAAMQFVQWLMAVGIAGLILAYAPFEAWMRVLIACNYWLLFEYAVFARSYTLGTLLCVGALIVWQRWMAWVLLALMVQTSAHFALLAGLLALYRLATQDWDTRGIVVFGGSCLLALWCMWPDSHVTVSREWRELSLFIRAVVASITNGNILFPLAPRGGWFFWEISLLFMGPMVFLAIYAVVFSIRLFDGDRARQVVMLLGLTANFLFTAMIYPVSVRHIGIASLLLLGLVWVGEPLTGERRDNFFKLSAAWAAQGVVALFLTIGGLSFASSTEAAKWIIAHGLEGETWAVEHARGASSITALTGRPTLDVRTHCLQTYYKENHSTAGRIPAYAYAGQVADVANAKGEAYLLLFLRPGARMIPPDPRRFRLLAKFGTDRAGYISRLYRAKFTPRVGPAPVLPAC